MDHKVALMEEVVQMKERLYFIANEFAGQETGHIACNLHQACGHITWADEDLSNVIHGPLSEDDQLTVDCVRRGAAQSEAVGWSEIEKLLYIKDH